MKSNQVLLYWGDGKERHALFKILCASDAEVRFADPAQAPSDSMDRNTRLIVVDYDSLRPNASRLLEQVSKEKRPPAVLVVTATRDKNDLIDLLSHEGLTNLVAKNTDVKATELVVTVQKIMRNDIFGLEKYLTWGVHVRSETVTSSDQKNGILDGLENYLTAIGCNKRLIGLAKGVGDEFLMNAVYNAPADANGKTKYASRSRAERVDLIKGEEVKFRYACDGRLLAMSVQDNFGRLEKSTVLNYLRKCFMRGQDQIDQKEGGAGLGLYYIFESLNHFIINLAPGKRTEMIGLIDVSGSYRDFAEQPKSLNIFIEEAKS